MRESPTLCRGWNSGRTPCQSEGRAESTERGIARDQPGPSTSGQSGNAGKLSQSTEEVAVTSYCRAVHRCVQHGSRTKLYRLSVRRQMLKLPLGSFAVLSFCELVKTSIDKQGGTALLLIHTHELLPSRQPRKRKRLPKPLTIHPHKTDCPPNPCDPRTLPHPPHSQRPAPSCFPQRIDSSSWTR